MNTRPERASPVSHNICIRCGANTVRTADSRITGQWRTRRKCCDTCFHRWTTVEVPAELLHNVQLIMESLHSMSASVDQLQAVLEQMRHLAMMEEGKPFSILSRQLVHSLNNEDTRGT
jgi:hypothetical protein